jgi:hypothetical protein
MRKRAIPAIGLSLLLVLSLMGCTTSTNTGSYEQNEQGVAKQMQAPPESSGWDGLGKTPPQKAEPQDKELGKFQEPLGNE